MRDHMTDDVLTALERQIDSEYVACFPGLAGWQSAGLHALLEYDESVQGDHLDGDAYDLLKFPLMHLFRWAVGSTSRPLPGIPHRADPRLLAKVNSALTYASGYVGVWFAFVSIREGISNVESISSSGMSLSLDPRWFAYDALDLHLHGESQLSKDNLQSLELMSSLVPKIGDYEPSQGPSLLARRLSANEEDATAFWTATHQAGEVLPQQFEFEGTSIVDLRKFWSALNLMSSAYLVGNLRRPPPNSSFARLMCGTRTEWTIRVRALSGLSQDLVTRLLELHSLRQHRDSDPGVTPLLPVGGNWLAASPALLCTAHHERNFCAYAARFHRSAFDRASGVLASQATADLAQACQCFGLATAVGAVLQTPLGSTDVDLAIYDPKHEFLLLVEHKSIIKTADFKEVLNRGQATCIRAHEQQLPKLTWCVEHEAEEFARRVFKSRSLRVAHAGSLLCTRGFVGTLLLERYPVPTLDELLFRRWLSDGSRLEEILRRAASREYLPRVGVDYRLERREIITPGGRVISVEDWNPC